MDLKSLVLGIGIGATIGTIIGAVFATKATSNKVKELADEIADEEVKIFVDDFMKRMNEYREADEAAEVAEEEPEPVDDAPYSRYNSLDLMHKPSPQELFKDVEEEHPQEPDEETDILEENPKEDYDDDSPSCKIISQDVFDSDDDDYIKETLYYYQDDDVLTNDNDEEIDEYMYVGDCLNKFNFKGSDQPEIHVRNKDEIIDYEVIKMFTSYRP